VWPDVDVSAHERGIRAKSFEALVTVVAGGRVRGVAASQPPSLPLSRHPFHVSSRAPEGPGPLTVRQPTERHGGNARIDEEVTMSTNDLPRRDARHCPRCGAMGILPLAQPTPVCEEECRATGMRWLGAFDVGDMTNCSTAHVM
jgi:hypothetical protein